MTSTSRKDKKGCRRSAVELKKEAERRKRSSFRHFVEKMGSIYMANQLIDEFNRLDAKDKSLSRTEQRQATELTQSDAFLYRLIAEYKLSQHVSCDVFRIGAARYSRVCKKETWKANGIVSADTLRDLDSFIEVNRQHSSATGYKRYLNGDWRRTDRRSDDLIRARSTFYAHLSRRMKQPPAASLPELALGPQLSPPEPSIIGRCLVADLIDTAENHTHDDVEGANDNGGDTKIEAAVRLFIFNLMKLLLIPVEKVPLQVESQATLLDTGLSQALEDDESMSTLSQFTSMLMYECRNAACSGRGKEAIAGNSGYILRCRP
jgi:hypothetical protein